MNIFRRLLRTVVHTVTCLYGDLHVRRPVHGESCPANCQVPLYKHLPNYENFHEWPLRELKEQHQLTSFKLQWYLAIGGQTVTNGPIYWLNQPRKKRPSYPTHWAPIFFLQPKETLLTLVLNHLHPLSFYLKIQPQLPTQPIYTLLPAMPRKFFNIISQQIAG